MTTATQNIDPITFEILSHRLHEITKEMGATLERVGGTVNTTQLRDYMAAIYTPNGDILAAGDSMGWHVACAGFAVKHIIGESTRMTFSCSTTLTWRRFTSRTFT